VTDPLLDSFELDGSTMELAELAALAGVHTEYHDMWGNLHRAPASTIKAVLASMGHRDVETSLRELKYGPWSRFVEPVLVTLEHEQPASIPIRFPLEEGLEPLVVLHVEFTEEDGRHEERTLEGIVPVDVEIIGGMRHVRVDIPNETSRPLGYHTLNVQVDLPGYTKKGSMRMIIAPERCHRPRQRCWGITLSLYGLRSEQNAGAGDLGDLKELIKWAGDDLNAGFIGINPLHSIPNSLSEGISPYSPISRLYRSLLYVDLNNTPFINEEDLKKAGKRLKELRETQFVDYDKVAGLKTAMLLKAFERFSERLEADTLPPGQSESYRTYLEQEGKSLERHATFMALAAHIRDTACIGRDWSGWPEEFQDPDSDSVKEFRESHAPEVDFQMFVQWVLDQQLEQVAEAAGDMPVGLYQDLAVGSSDCGSDTWAHQGVFALGMNTGAPPDDFNPMGQNWIFPPLLPEQLRQSGYEVFIKTLRSNLRHSGALRIDHALGLFRLFFIPEGRPASEGTYVDYPAEDLLKIIALESVRAGAAIIAEDLGTITDEARRGFGKMGMLSYRILYFERDWEHETFLPPESYPEESLSAVNTHDLPTLRGFWEARDISIRKNLGITDGQGYDEALAQRDLIRSRLHDALSPFIPEDEGDEMRKISLAAHSFLASSPSLLTSTSLDDINGSPDQQNMPGTTSGHPNWMRKSSFTLEGLQGQYKQNESLLASLVRIYRETYRTLDERDV